jgi:hypothetical protein
MRITEKLYAQDTEPPGVLAGAGAGPRNLGGDIVWQSLSYMYDADTDRDARMRALPSTSTTT